MNACVHCGNNNTVGICFSCLTKQGRESKEKYIKLLSKHQNIQSSRITELEKEVKSLKRYIQALEKAIFESKSTRILFDILNDERE